jgi:Sulfotransferase family
VSATEAARSAARPLLVTGAPRSGTTWVGHMLALAPGVGYLHEPFNPTTDPGIAGRPFTHFFGYVSSANEARVAPHLERALGFSYDLRRQLSTVRSPRALGRTTRDLRTYRRFRASNARPLMKDPIAVFSAVWLADRFGMDVVVTIRHPAAFVASFTGLGYRHDFNTFLAEPQLLVDYLGPFESDIRRFAAKPGDPVDEAVLLWRLVYHTVDRYRTERPDWLYVRHEDLSLDPVDRFREIYRALGLAFTDGVRGAIAEHSSSDNPGRLTESHGIRLDSRASLEGWRSRLTADEVQRIRDGVSDVSRSFYRDDEW